MTSAHRAGTLPQSPASQCPSDEELRRLVSGELFDAEQAPLIAHLDGCPMCRAAVEGIAGNLPLGAIAGLPSSGKADPPDPVLLRVVEQIKDEAPTTRFASSSTDGGEPVALDFLSPVDDPALLGRLGRYVIQEEIGRGASGIVLKALDERLGRIVALKVLSPRLATNEHARRRFVREAKAAAAIRDDHVIGIYHVEEVDGLPFLVMEYVVGRSLAQRLDADGPLPIADILRIGSQIARGLAAAHAQGLVHRDIKPANVLLENGVERVKITDFGLAHAVDDVRSTQPGVVLGTPEYMSPEQARGERVDHRSDLFSLGCVLYAMCAGRPPFRAESTMAILRRVCDDRARPLAEINADIPAWLADLIDRLIAKDPAERFQSAAEVADLLGQCLAHVQQHGAGVPPAVSVGNALCGVPPYESRIERSARNARDGVPYSARRWTIAVALLLLVTATLALAESTGVTHVAASVIRIVRGDGTLVVEVDDPNIQVLVDGEELVITGAGPKELRLRPGQHELQTVKSGKPAGTQLITITRDGRQVVKVAREQTAAGPPTPLTHVVWTSAASRNGTISPDGKYLSYVDWNTGDIGIYEPAKGTSRRLLNQGYPEFSESSIFSPDGKQLAYHWFNKDHVSELRTIGLDGSASRVLFPNAEKRIGYLQVKDWSADGKYILASFSRPDQIALISVADGSVRALKAQNVWWETMSFSPDGRFVAYTARVANGSRQRDIFLLPTDGGDEVRLVEHPADDAFLGWAPDGERILLASDRSGSVGVWLLRVVDGKPQGAPELLKGELGQHDPMGLTRSGSFYYALYAGGQNVYTATIDPETGKFVTSPVVAIQRSEGFNLSPAWSPDGSYLACLSTRRERNPSIYVRSSGTNEVRELVPSLRGFNANRLHWSPDGRALLVGGLSEEGERGALEVDVQTGAVKTLVPRVSNPFWSPDGKTLFFGRAGVPRRLIRREMETGVERVLHEHEAEAAGHFILSPDGTQLAFAEGGALKTMPATGGQPRELLKAERPIKVTHCTVAWAPDGRFLFFGRPNDKGAAELWRVPVGGGEPRKLDVALPAPVEHLRIHPDGRQIAFNAKAQPAKTEVWALENFLPPLADSNATASDASAAKSKSAAASGSAPAVITVREQPASTEPTTRRVWANAESSRSWGGVSLDDKHIAFVDWASGQVAVRELATGQSRRLSNEESVLNRGYHPIFSPDGRQVAYRGTKDDVVELRIVGFEEVQPRILYSSKDQDVYPLEPREWSADGKSILSIFQRKGKNLNQLVLVSVVDGSVRLLKESAELRLNSFTTFDERTCLSPDGRYVAYNAAPQKTSNQRDIFLLATDGSSEVPLVEHPADDFVIGWAPDGKRVLFASDRSGSLGLWLIEVSEGKPQGSAESVKRDMGQFQAVGLTRSGSFYYGVASQGTDVYTATLDLEQGKLLTPPALAIQLSEGLNFNPAWSPDGRYLACMSNRHSPRPLIYIRSLESKEVRELSPELLGYSSQALYPLEWSPDGRALLSIGTSKDGQRGAQRLDIQTGAVTHIPTNESCLFPVLGPDGKSLFYLTQYSGKDKPGRVLRRNLETGVEQELYQTTEFVMFATLSPDGQQLAVVEVKTGAVKLVPTAGGQPQELVKSGGLTVESLLMRGEGFIGTVAWTPDGRFLIYQKVFPQILSSLAKRVLSSGSPGPGDFKTELWRVAITGGPPEKLDVALPVMGWLRIHPDGRQIAFSSQGVQTPKSEIWVLENFLPPLADSKSAAAAAPSSGASQSPAAAASAPAVAAASEASEAEGPSMHLVWGADRLFDTGSSSPDGKYLAYRDLRSNEVAVRDLAAGTSRLITQRDHPEYGDFPIFSPDSRQIAFSWVRKDRVMELRTIGIDGTGLRVLFPNQDNEFQSLVPWDWSADGKTIVASASKGGVGQIALISVTDGSLRVLKTLDLSAPDKMCFSPDGRYVACSLNIDKSSRQRDIFLLATDGSGEAPLVENPGDDVVLGWTPDGKRLLFASDRTGTTGAWAIPLAEGKPVGKVELVRPGFGPIVPLGFTHSGDLYYALHSQGTDVYTATLDLETGKILTPPAMAIERGEGSNAAPDWSPDGRFLACASWRYGGSPLFYIRPAESTEVRELRPKLKQFSAISLRWSPDGRALIGAGSNSEGQEGVLRIDVQTGAVTMLLAGDVFKRSNFLGHPLLAPDGKELIFQSVSEDQGRRILRRNLDTSAERELYRYAGPGGFALSPDGRQLVIAEMPRPTPAPVPRSPNSAQILSFGTGHALKLLPADGGEPRELAKADGIVGALAWAPDGRHIIFQRLLKQRAELWRIAATGGEPEKLDATLPTMAPLSIHPDGRRIAFAAQTRAAKTEVWVLKNFLPPMVDSKSAAAEVAPSGSGAAAEKR